VVARLEPAVIAAIQSFRGPELQHFHPSTVSAIDVHFGG
jgi:hypothetical protein